MSLKEDVLRLKKEKNAIILAHYYVDGAVQDVADFVGDSYALAKKAKNTDADIIIRNDLLILGNKLVDDCILDIPMELFHHNECVHSLDKSIL